MKSFTNDSVPGTRLQFLESAFDNMVEQDGMNIRRDTHRRTEGNFHIELARRMAIKKARA